MQIVSSKLHLYFGLAIRINGDNLQEVKHVVWSIFFHKLSLLMVTQGMSCVQKGNLKEFQSLHMGKTSKDCLWAE